MLEKKDLKIKDISNSEYIEKLFKKLSKKKKLNILVNLENGEAKDTILEFRSKEVFVTDTELINEHVKITFIFNDYAFYFSQR